MRCPAKRKPLLMRKANPLDVDAIEIAIDPNKPVILCDADEVLVYFVRPFEEHLGNCGFYINLSSYSLFGNIRDIKTDAPASEDVCKGLLTSFFDTCVELCPPVAGAERALKNLAVHAQIIVLSNVPAKGRKGREQSLRAQGMPYRVIANEGPKGPAVQSLLHEHKSLAFFIDDIASHHKSVSKHAPHVRRIHFVADPRLGALIDKAEHAHARLNDWGAIEAFIMNDIAHPPQD